MRIISLETENVKRLRAVRIDPTGAAIVIGGMNGNGKTSVLDSIAMALGGKDLICEEPVRRGEKSARIRVDLGEFVVTRTFKEDGESVLKVTSAAGAAMPSPQKVLDSLIGSLSFDPLDFSRQKAAAQLQTLRDLVGIDTTKIDADRKAAFDERTLVNRDVKALEAQAAAAPRHKDAPAAEVSVAELSSRHTDAGLARGKKQKLEGDIERAERGITERKATIERLQKEIEDLESDVAGWSMDADGIEVPDVDKIAEQLKTAEATNRRVRENKAAAELEKKHKARAEDAGKLTLRIEALDKQKAELLAGAEFPVSGLGLSDTSVTLNGIPLSQASAAEQLRVSVAIGFAQNPKLKVVLIRDGSLLDERSLATVAQMAEDAGGQCWIERVGTGAECSVVIEDGEVRAPAAAGASA